MAENEMRLVVVPLLLLPLLRRMGEFGLLLHVRWFVRAPPVFVVVSCSLGVFLLFAYVGREDRREGNDQESWTKTETAAIKLAS